MIEEIEKLVEEAQAKGKLTPDERIDLMDELLAFELPEVTDENAEEVEVIAQRFDELMQAVGEIPDDESALPEGIPDPRIPELGDPRTGVFQITQAEQNGKLSGGRMNFSFGNGNEHSGDDAGGWGLVVPFDGLEIVAMTVGSRVGADNNGSSVQLVVIEDANKAKVFRKTDMVAKLDKGQRVAVSQGSVVVNAGQVVNFVTDNPGGDDVVVSLWGRWV